MDNIIIRFYNFLDSNMDVFKMTEWKYAEERKALIKFAETLIDKKYNKHIAMDLVDACLISAWRYQEDGSLFVMGGK